MKKEKGDRIKKTITGSRQHPRSILLRKNKIEERGCSHDSGEISARAGEGRKGTKSGKGRKNEEFAPVQPWEDLKKRPIRKKKIMKKPDKKAE